MTSTSSPPPLAIVPMMTMTNDCSWHQTFSWAGQPFPTMHNGFITFENVITVDRRRPSTVGCFFVKTVECGKVGSLPRRGMITTTITTIVITTICDRGNGGGERESETSPDPDPSQSRPDPDHTCSSLNALG